MERIQISKDFPDCFYRVTIKGLCVRDGKLLMIRESEGLNGGKWELPGGGLDFGNDVKTDFSREVTEEMGLTVAKMSERPFYVWTWKYVDRRSIDWFYSCVLAYRVEFDHLNITPSEECEEIKFFSKEELKSLKLSGQMTPLPDFFNPEDFTEPFTI